jgi:hypothetical protein
MVQSDTHEIGGFSYAGIPDHTCYNLIKGINEGAKL